MKNQVKTALLIAGVCSTSLVFGQQNSSDSRNDDMRRDEQRTNRNDVPDRLNDRREFNQRSDENRRYDNRYEGRSNTRSYDERDLSKAYDEGYQDGQRSKEIEERKDHRANYKRFTLGLYAGANSTRFQGENVQGGKLSGRLGYQAGFFVRGGGRVYGQIGAEYFTSSSELFQAGDGSIKTPKDIIGNVDQKYLQVPAYIGVKLGQSPRGVSAVRLAVGAEYAAPLGVNNNAFNFQQSDFRAATINGLANIGFDAGPLMLDFVYHYGFADVLQNMTNTKRRILGVNVGVKF